MKNVCFFNTIKFWGGGEKLHLEYALKFRERNYSVYLASKHNSPLSIKAKESGLRVFPVSANTFSFLNPGKYFRLFRFYKKEKIDTVIFSSSQDLKLGAFSSKLAGVRNIVYLRGLATPIQNSFINRILLKRVLTHIIANSQETKRTILKNLHHSVSPDKVRVIYHGIDLGVFNHPQQDGSPLLPPHGKGITLGNAGRLTSQKGQQYLVEVAKQLKQKGISFTLFIAGTGEMRSSLEDQIAAFSLQKEVILLGFVDNMEKFMCEIDIFLLTSVWEGFGYVIVEAMAAGKPVVAFNITSNPEIVENNETGYLVDYPDVAMFCQKTGQLIEDTELRMQFGKNARERVEKNFQLDDKITEMENYLNTAR